MSNATICVWRIVQASIYAHDDKFVAHLDEKEKAWSGGPSAEIPGRWNIFGNKVACAAESRALAAWEVFVHSCEVPELMAPDKHRVVKATIDRSVIDPKLIVDVPIDNLPEGWNKPPGKIGDPPSESQKWGHERLIEDNMLALRVPSVIIPGEFNYVINVNHPDFAVFTFSNPEQFNFDDRIRRVVLKS